MGVFDKIKNILTIPEEDEFEEEVVEREEKVEPRKPAYSTESSSSKRAEQTPRVLGGSRNKTVSFAPSQMQVVLVKPERYDDVTSIADHMLEKKTVVLNLETADRDLSRRIVDFLSGATYALHGNIKKVSKGTFLIVPYGVDMMGEMLMDDFENSNMYI